VIATSGTGIGQMLPVTSSSSSDGDTTLSLGGDWSVLPDSESELLVETTLYNSVFYNNSVQYVNSQYGYNLIGSAGIQISGGYGVVMDDNTVQYGNVGVLLSSLGFQSPGPPSNQFSPIDFVQVINNTITGAWQEGIGVWQQTPDTGISEQDLVGTIISGNNISGVTLGAPETAGNYDSPNAVPAQGISLGFGDSPGRQGPAELSVIENDTVSGCSYDIGVYDDAPDVLVYDNTFADNPTDNPNFFYPPDDSGATATFADNTT
jgi:Right handed beta helix region